MPKNVFTGFESYLRPNAISYTSKTTRQFSKPRYDQKRVAVLVGRRHDAARTVPGGLREEVRDTYPEIGDRRKHDQRLGRLERGKVGLPATAP